MGERKRKIYFHILHVACMFSIPQGTIYPHNALFIPDYNVLKEALKI
jgi:hypothetical protein